MRESSKGQTTYAIFSVQLTEWVFLFKNQRVIHAEEWMNGSNDFLFCRSHCAHRMKRRWSESWTCPTRYFSPKVPFSTCFLLIVRRNVLIKLSIHKLNIQDLSEGTIIFTLHDRHTKKKRFTLLTAQKSLKETFFYCFRSS